MSSGPDELYQQTLVIRSQLGDEAAFAELFARHGRGLLMFTQRMMQSSPADVADLTQEIWIAIFRALPGLLDVSKFRPWSFRIARDRIYREYRRRKLPAQPLEEINADSLEASTHENAIDFEELQHCLQCIGPEHREALVLRFFEEMSYEDIAQATGVTLGTVRSRIHYAKGALRRAWAHKTL